MRNLISQGMRVQMCVTSPPYWNLRDYGCLGQLGLESLHDCLGWATGEPCGDCHVCHMVEVFRLVRDLLTDDGTCWINYGDSYASAGGAGWQGKSGQRANRAHTQQALKKKTATGGLKRKDLVMMPARIALALQADGWYLRQDIIWHKPNPMPESVTDRCTKSHEYLYLLSKGQRYYFDAAAIREPVTGNSHSRGDGVNPKAKRKSPAGWDTSKGAGGHGSIHKHRREKIDIRSKQNESFSAAVSGLVDTRNKRSVWTIATQPYSEAHFATFPTTLIEPCILAGSRSDDVVLDPFFGSGTTGQVAQNLGRRWIGIDLNDQYKLMQKNRNAQLGLILRPKTS